MIVAVERIGASGQSTGVVVMSPLTWYRTRGPVLPCEVFFASSERLPKLRAPGDRMRYNGTFCDRMIASLPRSPRARREDGGPLPIKCELGRTS
jgi:hypothetical protein